MRLSWEENIYTILLVKCLLFNYLKIFTPNVVWVVIIPCHRYLLIHKNQFTNSVNILYPQIILISCLNEPNTREYLQKLLRNTCKLHTKYLPYFFFLMSLCGNGYVCTIINDRDGVQTILERSFIILLCVLYYSMNVGRRSR